MKRAFLVVYWLAAACNHSADLSLSINIPSAGKKLLASVSAIDTTATRDGVVLASQTVSADNDAVALSGVSYGARTVIALNGVDSDGIVVARGQTCPITFSGPGTSAPLYFAPTNFFAATSPPLTTRQWPVVLARTDGMVLMMGGQLAGGTVLGSTEIFTPGVATFAADTPTLLIPRYRAQGVALTSVGLLITGGLDAAGATIADAELYLEAQDAFLRIQDALLDARVEHRTVVLEDGRVLLSGGSNTEGGTPLATSLLIDARSDGAFQIAAGPTLAEPRREHASAIAIGVAFLFGGYGAGNVPTDSIEVFDPEATIATSTIIAHLQTARAEATATALTDGRVLVVGGVDATGTPLATAELFNPATRTSTLLPMASARRGHTATLLADGRVLVVGGEDASGPLSTVELFALDQGFVTERSLDTARVDHSAAPLCDGTVLIVGESVGAELYTPSPISG